MKKIYDFLLTDKEPFIYVEKTKIIMKDGFLTLLAGEDGKKILAPASHMILMLGAGTSITQDAAIFCAQHDLHISFVRGGSNIHSFFMEGRYQDPERLICQFNNQKNYKLEIAKKLMHIRFQLLGENNIEDINNTKSVDELTLYEARWAKSTYKKFCLKYKISNFRRDFNSTDVVNVRLNLLNNILYSLCSAIILSCHLSPSLAFIHGFSRRGGLAFDLADLIKTNTTVEISFSMVNDEKNNRQLMYYLMSKLKEKNNYLFKLLIQISLLIGEEYEEKKWNKLYENFNIK